jgi:hypothetical protein
MRCVRFCAGGLAAACLLALLGCASNEIWTTPLAPPRAAVDRCAVTTTTGPPEEPVDNLATVRCHFTGAGKSCVDLAIEQACQVGGDTVYGLHDEEAYLMGTIGVRKSTQQLQQQEQQQPTPPPQQQQASR